MVQSASEVGQTEDRSGRSYYKREILGIGAQVSQILEGQAPVTHGSLELLAEPAELPYKPREIQFYERAALGRQDIVYHLVPNGFVVMSRAQYKYTSYNYGPWDIVRLLFPERVVPLDEFVEEIRLRQCEDVLTILRKSLEDAKHEQKQ